MGYIKELELMDFELENLKASGCFIWTGKGIWVYNDDKAQELCKERGIKKLTMRQRQIYIFWKEVFRNPSVEGKEVEVYSGLGELSRRITLAIFGERKSSGSIGNMMKAIAKKLGE